MELWDQAVSLHEEARFVTDSELRKKKFDGAEFLYDQLLTQNHANAGLMATLGTLYLQTGRYGLAIHMLEAAIAAGLKQTDVMSNLAVSYSKCGQTSKSRQWFEKSIKDNPSGEALANYSGTFIETGEDDKMKSLCKRAIDLSPEHPIAHWNLSLALLADGEWAKAWDEYEWGLVNSVQRIDRKLGLNTAKYWDGTPGKRIAVYGEQGIGDEIMFASMLPDLLKTNDVVLECHARLKTLFEKSFPGIKVYGTREDEFPTWPADEPFEYRASIGSLGKYFRRSREAFPGTPYLKADAAQKGDKFRVGISWTGGLKAGRVLKRTVPLTWWKSILDNTDCEFVSLQYTDCKEEIDVVNALGYDIKQFPEIKADDYYETAKLVQSCDLVISVCTSVIHLAGALGVPCWVLTPKHPAWRYQNQGGMPWYRSVRLYRQPETKKDSWFPVIKMIACDLSELLNKRKAA